MAFSEGMAARNEGDSLLVIHRHAGEGLTDVPCCSKRVWIAIWAFRIDVNQSHLNGGQRVRKVAIATVSLVIEPLSFGAPIDVFFGFPDIRASTGKSKGFEPHRFQSNVSSENHQVGPRNFASILLFDRPE